MINIIADSKFDNVAILKRHGIERVDLNQNGIRVQTIENLSMLLNVTA
jgi:hypothetical protein